MKLKLNRGTTSKVLRIFVADSSQATLKGLAGLTYASSGLTWYYCREGDNATTSITAVTATLGTYTSAGFVAVDSTNMPGWYEIGVPNAVLASGNSVIMQLAGAANMTPVLIEVELDAVNYQSAANFGLSAIPTASPASSGGLLTVGSSAGQINPSAGAVPVSGSVTLNLAQAIPTSNTAQTVGDALNAARAQGFGKWVLSGTTLTLYASDGTTAVRTFTLDSCIGADAEVMMDCDRHAGPGRRPLVTQGWSIGLLSPSLISQGLGGPQIPPSGSGGSRRHRL